MFRRPRRGGDSSSLVVDDDDVDDARRDIESAVAGPSPTTTSRRTSSLSRSSRDNGGGEEDESEELRTKKKEEQKKKRMRRRRRTIRSSSSLFLLFLAAILLLVVAFFVVFVPRYALHFLLSIPIIAAGSVVVVPRRTDDDSSSAASRAVAGAFVSSILSQSLPSSLTGFVAAFGLGLFGLGTRRRDPPPLDDDECDEAAASTNGSDDRRRRKNEEERRRRNVKERKIADEKFKTVGTALLMIFNLLVENFFTWVVAATYYPSHNDTPTPLQDNGRTALIYVFETILGLGRDDVQRLRSGLNVPFALVSGLMASLACCELNWATSTAGKGKAKRRTLWAVSRRAMLTLATARFVRTISFLSTVLPSQVPNCYQRHYPPPPSDWSTWIQIGLLPNTEGGCNDLIVSGHATVTSVAAAVSASVSNSNILGAAMIVLLAFDYAAEVYQGYHYTVDMWMGGVLTAMIWKIYSFVEDDDEDEEEENDDEDDADEGGGAPNGAKGQASSASSEEEEFVPLRETTLNDLAYYFVPCFASYWVTIFAPSLVNPFVVTTCLFVVASAIKNGISQYVQHVLLCLLYAALGTYL